MRPRRQQHATAYSVTGVMGSKAGAYLRLAWCSESIDDEQGVGKGNSRNPFLGLYSDPAAVVAQHLLPGLTSSVRGTDWIDRELVEPLVEERVHQ